MSDTRLVRERGKRAVIGLMATCMAPMLLLLQVSSSKEIIRKDVLRWAEILGYQGLAEPWSLLVLLARYPEFRSLFYYRLSRGSLVPRVLSQLVKLIYRECPTLSISARDAIGPGLFIQHGFSTVVAAQSIGSKCLISHQATVGYTTDPVGPRLGNNVVVSAGARVLGAVRVTACAWTRP